MFRLRVGCAFCCSRPSWWLVALVIAVVACSGPRPHATNASGADAGLDAPGGGGGSDVDGGLDGGMMTDAPSADVVAMCGTMPETPDDWERCRLRRLCETIVHCSEQNLYADVKECVELSDALSGGEAGFEAFETARAVAAGRAAIDPVAFTQCLGELSPARCATAGTAPSCATRYTGTIADGQACFGAAECASPGARCARSECGASCCTGTCTRLATLGEACHDFAACEPGLVCSVTGQTCVSGDPGAACGHLDCDAGSWCDDGTCRRDVAEGARCDSLLACGGETSCVGLRRDVGPPTCRHLTAAGDACDWFCLGNLYCDLSGPQGLGVCRPLPGLGDGCSALLPCVGQTLRCSDEGVCVARSGLGEPCRDGTCMPGQFCADQLGATDPVCRLPFEDGDSGCRRDAQCKSHICSGDDVAPGQCQASGPTCS